MKNYCPICGNLLPDNDTFARGEICLCCGNESGFEDDITQDELDQFDLSVLKSAHLTKEELMIYEVLPLQLAHKLLRAQWIVNGCHWKYGENPLNNGKWHLNNAKQNLLNINVNYDDYLS